MKEKEYNRVLVNDYAKKWAYRRNPKYYNFDNVGGDCTSFVSQCIFAGCNIMNYTKYLGWYYISANDRSPSWSGVEFLYNFLISNKSVGPRAKISNESEVEIGDIVQLKFKEKDVFSHSLVIVDKNENDIFVSSHTNDSYYRKLSTYTFDKIRFLHITNVYT